MESRSINDTLWMRLLTLGLHKFNRIKWIRRLRTHPGSILLVSSKLCIKSTGFTTLAEAKSMQFIAQRTSIPVPKVHCSFQHKGRVYILMERINGGILGDGWLRRSEVSKAAILTQLKTMVEELRAIPPPDNVGVANILGGPVFDLRLPDKAFWGPYSSIRDFHLNLRRGILLKEGVEPLPGLRELVAFHDEQPWPKPVFTHGDLSSLNIMAVGDQITGIVDWETSGWLPPYWEYVSAWHVNPHNSFWRESVDSFLTPLPHDLEMDKIRRRYFSDFS